MNTQLFIKDDTVSAETKNYILEQVNALEKYHAHILGAKVEVRRDTHHTTGRVYYVHVTLRTSGDRLNATESAETVEAGIDMVRDELQRQLRRVKERQLTKRRVSGRLQRLLKGFPLRKH